MRAELPARYEDAGRIGVGGMGEVRRVRDRELGRTCAYKAIRADLGDRPGLVARFVDEARIGAQLQHPNIPPIYDAGRLEDGRPWFTMKEVHGRTFAEIIRLAHRSEVTTAALRRLCDILVSVCDAVGYAHGRGVVHRDLKPDNVMVGSHGEVYVLDWGLAKVIGQPEPAFEVDGSDEAIATFRSVDDSLKTRAGGVLGTAAYMPPEQARGEVDRVDARSDVYALGAILYELLAGRPPYEGRDVAAVVRQVLAGPPEPPGQSARETFIGLDALEAAPLDVEAPGPSLPTELVELCMRCLAADGRDRPADGAVVAEELRAWLDGATKRAKALEVVAAAEAVVTDAAGLRERAAAIRADGDAKLLAVPLRAPEEEKAEGWALQDEAQRLEREATLAELRREALLRGALTHAPELAEAHVALVELELARHRAAEADRDADGAARAEQRIREHLHAVHEAHPTRARAAAWLEGDGALSLATDPEGAEVMLYRFERRNRRLVEVPAGSLGRTPLVDVALPMGSYLCALRHPERALVRYPVHIGRGERWEAVPPGASEARPVHLPLPGELGPDDCLVPAGWFWSGGDPEAAEGLPRRRLWCDDLVVRRFPVTNREYILFLDDLVTRGREEEALRHQPRERSAGEGAPVYGRDDAGRFVLRPDADGDRWDPDWPVILVDWPGAAAYAAWLAERDGRPWQLPGELEWEKATRGADGRFFPWGDFPDASWCCVSSSHAGRPLPQRVDSYPIDTSVYGVRGLGGNVAQWCGDTAPSEPWVDGGRVVPTFGALVQPRTARTIRGGYWYGKLDFARSANRVRTEPGARNEYVGFRISFRR